MIEVIKLLEFCNTDLSLKEILIDLMKLILSSSIKPEYDVHHINEDKKDNRIENLEILTRSEHTIHHNHSKCVGVVKSGNIGEGCDANPEISSEITKGSEPSYSVEGE